MPDEKEEIEVKGIELPEGTPDLFDVGEPVIPEPVAEEQPSEEPKSEEKPPESEKPAETPALPDWLSTDPAERKVQLEAALNALAPEERLALGPITDVAQAQRQLTAQEVSQRLAEQYEQRSADVDLEASATAFADELNMWLPAESGIDVNERTNNLISDAQANYHVRMVQDVQKGFATALTRAGVTSIPEQVINAANGAQSFSDVIDAYASFNQNVGYQAGLQAGGKRAETRSEADKIADRNRMQNEILGKLGKEGTIRIARDQGGDFLVSLVNDTPPQIAGQPGSLSGELSQEEFDAAMRDGAAYEQLMNGPKGDAMRRLFAEALKG